MPRKDPAKRKEYNTQYYARRKVEISESSKQRLVNDEEWRNKLIERSRKYREKFPEKSMFRDARKRARKKNLEFSIQVSDIIIPEVCPVFGTILVLNIGAGGGVLANSPTLDRIDPTKGYTKDNIWVISWRANKLKSNATLQELKQLAAAWREKIKVS